MQLGSRRHDFIEGYMPVWQTEKSVVYAAIRAAYEYDTGKREGNAGFVYRVMTPSDWILGLYGYGDLYRSENGFIYAQTTIGLEAKTERWDVRVNGYLPLSDTRNRVDFVTDLDVREAELQVHRGQEILMRGLDGEIGMALGEAAWLYAGRFYFQDPAAQVLHGGRLRFELRFMDGFLDIQDSRLTLTGVYQNDNLRGSQGYFGLRLRLPFHFQGSKPALTPLDHRMLDPVIRDVD